MAYLQISLEAQGIFEINFLIFVAVAVETEELHRVISFFLNKKKQINTIELTRESYFRSGASQAITEENKFPIGREKKFEIELPPTDLQTMALQKFEISDKIFNTGLFVNECR